jgi:transposase
MPSWLLEPLWDQFAALLPDRPVYDPSHPLGCHKPRIGDRIIFEKLIQVLRFDCSYASIADCTCGATTIRERRSEWIEAGIFGQLKTIARESYDRIVGLVLEDLAVDGCITKAPGGGECAGRSPVDRGKPGMKRSLMVEGKGIPLGRVLAPREPARLPAPGRHPGQARRHRAAARRDHRPSRRRVRLAEDPRRARRPRHDRGNRP